MRAKFIQITATKAAVAVSVKEDQAITHRITIYSELFALAEDGTVWSWLVSEDGAKRYWAQLQESL